jgi:hypothetical protein
MNTVLTEPGHTVYIYIYILIIKSHFLGVNWSMSLLIHDDTWTCNLAPPTLNLGPPSSSVQLVAHTVFSLGAAQGCCSVHLDIASYESNKKFLPNISNLHHFQHSAISAHLIRKCWEVWLHDFCQLAQHIPSPIPLQT